MFRRAFRVIAEGGFAPTQQRQARFETPAHIFQKRRAGGHIEFQHFGSQFQFHPRIAFSGEALECAAVFGERQMDAMQILQMRGDALAAVAPAPTVRPEIVWLKPAKSRMPAVPVPPRVNPVAGKALSAPSCAVPSATSVPPV